MNSVIALKIKDRIKTERDGLRMEYPDVDWDAIEREELSKPRSREHSYYLAGRISALVDLYQSLGGAA